MSANVFCIPISPECYKEGSLEMVQATIFCPGIIAEAMGRIQRDPTNNTTSCG